MRMKEERIQLDGHELLLRCAEENEAQMMIDYLKTVCGETRFLLHEADEVHYTPDDEREFIRSNNEAEDKLLMLAFLDGKYAGNCSFQRKGTSRRHSHRAEIGIALYQEYTGRGIGRIMLERLIAEIQKAGYEQVDLTVIDGNERAYSLYKKLGFLESGRIPRANKYGDGTYADDILMTKMLG